MHSRIKIISLLGGVQKLMKQTRYLNCGSISAQCPVLNKALAYLKHFLYPSVSSLKQPM